MQEVEMIEGYSKPWEILHDAIFARKKCWKTIDFHSYFRKKIDLEEKERTYDIVVSG
jgi:hypothetical protein